MPSRAPSELERIPDNSQSPACDLNSTRWALSNTAPHLQQEIEISRLSNKTCSAFRVLAVAVDEITKMESERGHVSQYGVNKPPGPP